MKKTPGNINILHMCTIIDNHMIYGSWDMDRGRQNFLSFGPFYALSPPKTLKNQNFEKMEKKCLEISSFYTCVPEIMITWRTVPEIWCAMDGWTDKQTNGRTEGWMDRQTDGWTDRPPDGQTDRQTDGWKKWHIEMGVPPKNRKVGYESMRHSFK